MISHGTIEVREMPLARRDWTNLLNVGTGVEVRGSGGGTGISLNGLPPGGFSLTVDGTQASASSEETSLTSFGNFNLIKVVSLEAISEVNVNKGIVQAEYANTLSGNVGLITKSGTNSFHGSVFENYQNAKLNARNQFLTTKPARTLHQFGGSLGGPIVKNRLFGFGVYEGYRQSSFVAINSDVPTAEYRALAIAAVPAYQQFFDTLPLPNQSYAAGARTGVFIGSGSSTANDDHVVARGDYNIDNHNRISSRYTRGRPDSLSPRVSPVNSRTFTGLDDAFTASYFRIGSSFSAETRFGFSRNDVTRLDEIYTLGIAGIAGLTFTVERWRDPGEQREELEHRGDRRAEQGTAFDQVRRPAPVSGPDPGERGNSASPVWQRCRSARQQPHPPAGDVRPAPVRDQLLDERLFRPGRLQDPPEPGRQPGPPLRLLFGSHRTGRSALQPRRPIRPRAADSGIGGNLRG